MRSSGRHIRNIVFNLLTCILAFWSGLLITAFNIDRSGAIDFVSPLPEIETNLVDISPNGILEINAKGPNEHDLVVVTIANHSPRSVYYFAERGFMLPAIKNNGKDVETRWCGTGQVQQVLPPGRVTTTTVHRNVFTSHVNDLSGTFRLGYYLRTEGETQKLYWSNEFKL